MIWYVVVQRFENAECEVLKYAAWQEIEFLPNGMAMVQDDGDPSFGFDLVHLREIEDSETTFRTYFRDRAEAEKYLKLKKSEAT